MKPRYISATEFKAKCLALLDEVDERGEVLTITKRGRPVATVQRAKAKSWKSPEGIWAGKLEIVGDIVNFSTAHLWEALKPGAIPGEPFRERARTGQRPRRKAS
jgi:prevent-host-death family protein